MTNRLEEYLMKTDMSVPEIGLVAITRALLGAGVAFVVADRLDTRERKAVGWTLTGVGVLTTVPLLLDLFLKRRRESLVAEELDEIDEDREEDAYEATVSGEPVDVIDPQRDVA